MHFTKQTFITLHGMDAKTTDQQAKIALSPHVAGERVWCVANPLETLVVRRRGKVMVIGNSWWRHGSPNVDRPWADFYEVSVREVQDLRLDRMREKKEPEPWVCPKCGQVRSQGQKCWKCGYVSGVRQRMVLQANGVLKAVTGDIVKPRRTMRKPNTQRLWDKIFYGSRNSKSSRPMTFKQAEALFYLTYHYYPPRSLANMPRKTSAWYRTIRDIDQGELITPTEARLNDAQRKNPAVPF